MKPDEEEFYKVLLNHITLLEGVRTRIESAIQATPIEQRGELEVIRERVSDVIGLIKADVMRLL